MDGGMPGPKIVRVIEALKETGLPLDIVAAWGRKAPPAGTLEDEGAPSGKIRILGRHNCIESAMRRVDLVVTKAGSLALAEALAVGRPVLIHCALPGQEASNPSFGAGIDAPIRRGLIDAVRGLGRSPLLRGGMSRSPQLHGRPGAALGAAGYIAGAGRTGDSVLAR